MLNDIHVQHAQNPESVKAREVLIQEFGAVLVILLIVATALFGSFAYCVVTLFCGY